MYASISCPYTQPSKQASNFRVLSAKDVARLERNVGRGRSVALKPSEKLLQYRIPTMPELGAFPTASGSPDPEWGEDPESWVLWRALSKPAPQPERMRWYRHRSKYAELDDISVAAALPDTITIPRNYRVLVANPNMTYESLGSDVRKSIMPNPPW